MILSNNSDINVQYGNPYEIEIKKNDSWHKIDGQLVFTLPAFILKSGGTKEIEINWENGYGRLSDGTYRIIKDIGYEKEDGTFEKIYVSTEFTIK